MGNENTFTDILTEKQEHILRIKINLPPGAESFGLQPLAQPARQLSQAVGDGLQRHDRLGEDPAGDVRRRGHER